MSRSSLSLSLLLLPIVLSPIHGQAPSVPPASPPASAKILAQINIRGLEKTSEAEVLGLLKARTGEPYPEELAAADLAALLGSGKFTSASLRPRDLSPSALRLDIELVEGSPAPEAGRSEEEARPPWVIGELALRGNKHSKLGSLRSQMKARLGELYERSDLDRDIQALLALGQFERVAADIVPIPERPVPAHLLSVTGSDRQSRLTFIVEEKPLVRKLAVSGHAALSRGRILDAVTLKAKDPLDRLKLSESEAKILELYRKKGHHRAAVASEVSLDSAALQADVLFRVSEGPRSRIRVVLLEGASAFPERKLRKQMKNRLGKIYSEKDFPEDLKKIEAYYKNRGYLDFEIARSSVLFDASGTSITLSLALREGVPYTFGETSFSGHSLYASTELAKALEYRPGKRFNQEKFASSVQGVQELYAEKGYLDARVSPEKTFNPDTRRLDVRLEIEEGGRSYVDHVDIEGNKATKTHVLKREVVLKPGQPFSLSKLRKSAERIRNLGFIDDVQPNIQRPLPGKLDLTLEVFEGKPGMLTAGAGYSSLDGLVGTMSLQHLNLLGRAYRTSVQWSFGARVQDYSVSWTTPWVGNSPTSLGFDVFNTRRLSAFDTSSTAFMNRRLGGSVRLGPRFEDDKYQMNFNYTFQKIGVTNVESQFLDRLSEGTSIHSSLGAELAIDTRDNIWDPASGGRQGVGATLAGGPLLGDIHFIKPYLSNSYHRTLFSVGDYPFVLSLSNRGGYVTQFGKTKEVPVFERFFIGGQDSLRGYSISGEAGHRDGGKLYDVFNIEFGFPLARERRRTIVKFVTFLDAGGSWDTVRSARLRVGTQERDVKTDVGFGIRFTTPAFPVRLDWGYGLNHRPGEQLYQINFGIGSLF